MSSEPPSARWLVRALIHRASEGSSNPEDRAGVAFEACEHTYRDLARDLGTASAQALVNRARAQAGMAYPALLDVQLYTPRDAGVSISSTARKSDCTATAEEFEALLEALLALLGRFVGINIVVQLLAARETRDAPLTRVRDD